MALTLWEIQKADGHDGVNKANEGVQLSLQAFLKKEKEKSYPGRAEGVWGFQNWESSACSYRDRRNCSAGSPPSKGIEIPALRKGVGEFRGENAPGVIHSLAQEFWIILLR